MLVLVNLFLLILVNLFDKLFKKNPKFPRGSAYDNPTPCETLKNCISRKPANKMSGIKMGGGKSKTLKRKQQTNNKSKRRFSYGGRKAYDQRKK